MVAIAIGNGALRALWLSKHFAELRAAQASVASGIVLPGIYMGHSLPNLAGRRSRTSRCPSS
jgi:hypothetical protein